MSQSHELWLYMFPLQDAAETADKLLKSADTDTQRFMQAVDALVAKFDKGEKTVVVIAEHQESLQSLDRDARAGPLASMKKSLASLRCAVVKRQSHAQGVAVKLRVTASSTSLPQASQETSALVENAKFVSSQVGNSSVNTASSLDAIMKGNVVVISSDFSKKAHAAFTDEDVWKKYTSWFSSVLKNSASAGAHWEGLPAPSQ